MNDVAPTHTDERITYRGPLQRLLISPEIGALVGTAMVWALFWATGQKFGTAASTASWLDVAAPLGIMAVAVALLMIGGEFDLSAGVMTGSTGIMVGLFAQKFMGDGASLWIAVPIAFLAAGVIGWFNGTLVNRTKLPSFIVTLATFFILRGVNLVFSKRLVDKVLVENIDAENVRDFEFFRKVFASVHNKDTFGARDGVFLALAIGGIALLAVAALEMALVRRERPNAKALPVFAGGLGAAIVGLWLTHSTDGVGANALAAVVGLGGAVVAVAGLARWRYEGRALGGAWSVPASRRSLVGGLLCVALAWILTRWLDGDQRRVLLSVPAHGVKVVVGVLSLLLGAGLVVTAALRRSRSSGKKLRTGDLLKMAVVAMVGALVVLVGVLSFLQLTTEQGARAILLVGVGFTGIALLLVAKLVARRESPRAQLAIGVLTAAVVVFYAFVLRHDASDVRFRSGLFTAMLLVAAAIVANSIVEATCVKRRLSDHAAEVRGRVLGAVGVGMLFLGMAIRLFFTGSNFRVSVLWWIIATAVAAYVLARTRWGNWIFAVGGNKDAARAVGVPADQVKVGLFMMVSLVGCFVGMLTALRFSSVAASQGIGEEFEYIIAAVVGGCLLTGGYGSVIGASLGAMIMAMTINGIPAARWNSDNRFIFLGAVLFVAVLVNQKIRQKAQEAR